MNAKRVVGSNAFLRERKARSFCVLARPPVGHVGDFAGAVMVPRPDMAQFTSSGLHSKWSALRAARRSSIASMSELRARNAARAAVLVLDILSVSDRSMAQRRSSVLR